jgi:8-oxo-dGTP pyrophosphatase MutT (NUDIX family)
VAERPSARRSDQVPVYHRRVTSPAATSAAPRPAASVILLRRRDPGGYEVFLVRRRRGASFMASAFVFPGGGADATDGGDPRVTAARELFEEAGVLLTGAPIDDATRARWRHDVLAAARAGADAATAATAALHAAVTGPGAGWATAALAPWAHWITPSVEPRRFDTRFFVAELPPGQEPSFDDHETVDQVWVAPAEALVRAGELALPPPQLRTFWELARLPGVDDVLAEAGRRAGELAPILPRGVSDDGRLTLLLPWDPDYHQRGQGDAASWSAPPRWATGRSRFTLVDRTWSHDVAPTPAPAR